MRCILLATVAALSMSGPAWGEEATLPIRAAIISYKDYQTLQVKVKAKVVDGLCDMQRNPDSPECLSLIEPAAGMVTAPEDCPEGSDCHVDLE